jgi:hypothetical protein
MICARRMAEQFGLAKRELIATLEDSHGARDAQPCADRIAGFRDTSPMRKKG